ncbi:enoyl-CoA hydratase/isomerase family protein [Agromyces protaetiae]|uniref:Enoyl-CoA hydratase/isomerase family protein n=1 Tax=Agromyces protaetiae TaxID=2509455 RepID=A0A4P6FB31_9MICO|nr:enoyl-CoA hydratase/isomerase family protein [Agromyces protaetiae]QAY72796.1 enoyl-CoA hydratase/isomerase family protein [Agromyces protaetiae]
MSDDAILFDVTDGLARITLNRPDRLNAVGPDAIHRWREIAREVAARDDIRAVLFDAVGRAFCAGGDVRAMAELAAASQAEGEPDVSGRVVTELADVIHEGHKLLRDAAVPIVAAVQGAVAGGGLGFMLTADVIVASEAAIFQCGYVDIGLTPDCGVSWLLPEAVGQRRALELTLTSKRLNAADALAAGLVTEVVAPDALADRALEIARTWAAGPGRAYGEAKRLVRAAAERSYQESLDDEARTIGQAFESPDAQARIAAFTRR